MGLGNALRKINAEARRLRKKHPGAKYSTLQKQAGKAYKAGKLKNKKRRKVGKVAKVAKVGKVRKRKATRRKAAKPRVVVRTRTRTVTKVRRVGKASTMDKLLPVLAIAGIGLLAYKLISDRPAANSQQYMPTGNYQRDNSAANILAWATAGGIAINAIANLIQMLNSKSDNEVVNASQQVQNSGQLPPGWLA